MKDKLIIDDKFVLINEDKIDFFTTVKLNNKFVTVAAVGVDRYALLDECTYNITDGLKIINKLAKGEEYIY